MPNSNRVSRMEQYKLMLLGATALGAALAPSMAQAQEAIGSDDAAPTQLAQASANQSSTTAATTPASADSSAIQDIVVTAQFRAQNLQDTPLAITAISGDQLLQRGIQNVQDLTNIVPSVSLHHTGSAGGKTLAAFIRGVGASDYNFGIEPGVAFYIDDVYLGPSYGTLLEFIDLERAEVLRGPQGTLSGKNAIGGAIRLVTAKPRGQNEGYIQVETGSRGLLRMRAAYDISLVPDTLFMRVSGYSANQNGLVKVLDFACVNPTLTGDQTAPYRIRDTSPRRNASAAASATPMCGRRDCSSGGPRARISRSISPATISTTMPAAPPTFC